MEVPWYQLLWCSNFFISKLMFSFFNKIMLKNSECFRYEDHYYLWNDICITSSSGHFTYIYRNIMKGGEMKHEMTLFHTMEPNRNVLFQTHLFSVTIYGLFGETFNIRWCWSIWKSPHSLHVVMNQEEEHSVLHLWTKLSSVWVSFCVWVKSLSPNYHLADSTPRPNCNLVDSVTQTKTGC